MLRGGARLAAAGAVAGTFGALASTHLLATQLYGVQAFDPRTFALAGSWLPARRAARVAPVIALRND